MWITYNLKSSHFHERHLLTCFHTKNISNMKKQGQVPVVLSTMRSIPWSSWVSWLIKSCTVWVTGLRVNLHRSRREGSGTVSWGRPLHTVMVTPGTQEQVSQTEMVGLMDWLCLQCCFLINYIKRHLMICSNMTKRQC